MIIHGFALHLRQIKTLVHCDLKESLQYETISKFVNETVFNCLVRLSYDLLIYQSLLKLGIFMC